VLLEVVWELLGEVVVFVVVVVEVVLLELIRDVDEVELRL
jgi:hypothetical protein